MPDASPTPSLTQHLTHWLENGGRHVGQAVISPTSGGYELRHEADAAASAESLATLASAEAVREISLHDAAGAFRPVKAAPTLRTGWRFVARDAATLRLALDFLYPAALGNWVAFSSGKAHPVTLRTTLGRQTGMYRVTALVDDAGADAVVCTQCDYATKCRRRITWGLTDTRPIHGLPPEKTDLRPHGGEWPILCLEACNWLVAQMRTHVKKAGVAPAASPGGGH